MSAQASSDDKLTPRQREELGADLLPRAIVLLREAIDANPELGDRIKIDKDFNQLKSRPEFTTIPNDFTLTDIGDLPNPVARPGTTIIADSRIESRNLVGLLRSQLRRLTQVEKERLAQLVQYP